MQKALVVTLICLGLVMGVLAATMHASQMLYGFSTMAICAFLCFVIQWVVYVPAYLFQTERFYDLTGCLTFISLTLFALLSSEYITLYSVLMASMVIIWAVRLGGFLTIRIFQDGHDDRFTHIKPNKYRFYVTWTIQGLWVFLTSMAAIVVITTNYAVEVTPITLIGMMIWLVGFFIEVIADYQKRQFRQQYSNTFIQSGLWAYSRHPNYLGEIILWLGVAIAAIPALHGWQHIVLISPVFVALLLIKISGIPILEAKADIKWGDDENYISYKERTPVLLPFKQIALKADS